MAAKQFSFELHTQKARLKLIECKDTSKSDDRESEKARKREREGKKKVELVKDKRANQTKTSGRNIAG
jgi:hypothetical protein